MAQSGRCPQETLGTGRDTVADCGLCLTHQIEAGHAEEEEEPICMVSTWQLLADLATQDFNNEE